MSDNEFPVTDDEEDTEGHHSGFQDSGEDEGDAPRFPSNSPHPGFSGTGRPDPNTIER